MRRLLRFLLLLLVHDSMIQWLDGFVAPGGIIMDYFVQHSICLSLEKDAINTMSSYSHYDL